MKEMEKFCRGCGELKSTNSFYTRKDYKDGLSTYCRSCSIKKQLEYKKKPKRKSESETGCDGSWLGNSNWIY